MVGGQIRGQRNGPISLSVWGAWLIYMSLTVLMTWPLATSLGSRLSGADQDILNVFWGNWWIPKALAAGVSPYATQYLIYPEGFDLTSFAFSPVLALAALPFRWLVSPIAAYNLVFWIVIVLSCVAMDQLVRHLTDNPWAALISGVTFGFSPILAGHRATHLNMATVMWLPWAALLVLRLLREARLRDALLLAAVAMLAFLTRLQVGVLAALFCGVVLLGRLLMPGEAPHPLAWRRLVLATAVALVLLSPLLFRVGRAMSQPDAGGVVREASQVQADVLSYLTPPPAHPVFGQWTGETYTNYPHTASLYWTYVGFVPLALALCGVAAYRRTAMPWLLASLCFFIFALGTSLRLGGEVYPKIRLPYGVAPGLFATLGFDSPDRFDLAMIAAVAALVGLGSDWMTRRMRWSRAQMWFLLLAVPAVLFEYATIPMALMTPPPASDFYTEMAADDAAYAVVDFPLTRAEGEVHRYYQTLHQKPIVGGWDHRVPASAFSFMDSNPLLGGWLGAETPDLDLAHSLDMLSSAGVRYIILHKNQPGTYPDALQPLYLALAPVYEDGEIYVLSTAPAAAQAFNVVRSFGSEVDLVRPYVTARSLDGVPVLEVAVCWVLHGGAVDTGLAYDVTLYDPAGAVVAATHMGKYGPSTAFSCQRVLQPFGPQPAEGVYHVTISLPAFGGAAEGHMLALPVHFAGGNEGASSTGAALPWLGESLPVTVDAPIAMLGYRLQDGDGVLLVDTYWRALEDHSGSYELFMQLLDPVTGLPVIRSNDDTIPSLTWHEGDMVVDRRILMVNDVEPGQYRLAVGVYRSEAPGQRLTVTLGPAGSPILGGQVVLEDAVLVLPHDWQTAGMSTTDRILLTTTRGPSGTPDVARQVQFGASIRLLGYSLPAEALICSEPFELTLVWEAEAVPQANYKVFVHVVDGAGQLVAQHDGDPASGQRPTTTWRAGDKALDTHTVPWITEACPDTVEIRVGLYDPYTGERLTAVDEGGVRLPDDQVVLGESATELE